MSHAPLTLDHSVPLGAIWTSFTLTLRNLLRPKRLLTLMVLFLVPLLMLIVFRTIAVPDIMRHQGTRGLAKEFLQVEFFAIFIVIANVAAPLTILLFATGMIRDEQENQTLTYVLVRPVPKWALYLTKLLAAVAVSWFLTTLGLAFALVTLWAGSGQPPAAESLGRLLWMVPSFGLLLAANGAVFAFISVLFRRSLILGAVYIALFEGFLANFPFVLRKITNLHYFQAIIVNLLGDGYRKYDVNARMDPIMVWPLAREVVPDTQEAVITLLSVFVLATLLGMYLFTVREFRMKTPEGT